MRAIEEKVSSAITSKKPLSCQNTVVKIGDLGMEDHCSVYLHGNLIFGYNYTTQMVFWDDCGWPTMTTSSRLNACFDAVTKLSGKRLRYSRKNGTGRVVDIATGEAA